MAGRLNFEFSFGQPSQLQRDQEGEKRFYLCGDFSGQTDQEAIPDKIIKIDIDNFDTVMAKLSPTLHLQSGHLVTFKELDNFHPDNLLKAVPGLADLCRLKQQLAHPQTAKQAADEIWQKYRPAIATENANSGTETMENTDDALERLLGAKPTAVAAEIKVQTATDAYINRLIAPHVVADTKPEHQALSVFVTALIEDALNQILHNPEFQALEALWRSVYVLLFDEEADENQSFYLVNVSKAALTADMQNPVSSRFAALLKNHDIAGVNSIIIGNYRFSAQSSDISLLHFLGSVAEQCNSYFIGAADEVFVQEQILAAQPIDKEWQRLRQSSVAACLALCCPRILLRLPYGKKYEPVEGVEFEEFRQQPVHNQLLWGNPAFAWARLLVRQNSGMPQNEINNLPALVYVKDDEQHLQACGEWFLSEAQVNMLLAHGIMPFMSFKNRNSVRLLASQALCNA